MAQPSVLGLEFRLRQLAGRLTDSSGKCLGGEKGSAENDPEAGCRTKLKALYAGKSSVMVVGSAPVLMLNLRPSSTLLFNRSPFGWSRMTADSVHGLLRSLFPQHCFKSRRKLAWPCQPASPGTRPAGCRYRGRGGHCHSCCRGRPPQTGCTRCQPRRMCPAPSEAPTAWHPPGPQDSPQGSLASPPPLYRGNYLGGCRCTAPAISLPPPLAWWLDPSTWVARWCAGGHRGV